MTGITVSVWIIYWIASDWLENIAISRPLRRDRFQASEIREHRQAWIRHQSMSIHISYSIFDIHPYPPLPTCRPPFSQT
jgi:hypothetical protein